MPVVGWVDTAALDETWFDHPDEPELSKLLRIAQGAVLAYAPNPLPSPMDQAKQDAYGMAQELHAKHLYARGKAGNGDSVGPDGYQVSTYPLVMEARSLVRPKGNPFKGVR